MLTHLTATTLGPYKLLRSLGKGGMGEVLEAQAEDGPHVALKVFLNEGEHAAFLLKRFMAEGKLLNRLDHHRLVKVRSLHIDSETGLPYFVMDLVLGPTGEPQTLEDLRRQRQLNEKRIAEVYADLCEGLTYLHAQGVAHRDIKLENILIDSEGHAVLSDFGISRIFDKKLKHEMSVTTTMTGEGAPIMGSFGYLAPELKKGESATPASDAYALGVLIFRMLTGLWYEADSTVPDMLSAFDPAWENLFKKLLNENPSKRLPMPESVVLGAKRVPRLLKWILALLALTAIGAVLAYGYFKTHTPVWTFDEFFPEERQ